MGSEEELGWALKPGGWCSEPLVGLRVICWAEDMLEKDLRDNRSIGDLGAHHILKRAAPQGGKVTVLTHCNTGALATAGYGTALGEWVSTGMGEGPFWMKEKETQTTICIPQKGEFISSCTETHSRGWLQVWLDLGTQ